MPLAWSNLLNSSKALFHSASDLSVMSMPGSMRQNRSGQTAMKPRSATQAAMSRIAWFTPKISWISTTTPAGCFVGSSR